MCGRIRNVELYPFCSKGFLEGKRCDVFFGSCVTDVICFFFVRSQTCRQVLKYQVLPFRPFVIGTVGQNIT